MYVPKHFREDNIQTVKDLVRDNPFAILVTTNSKGPIASHLPVEVHDLDNGSFQLVGHLARANTQWETLSSDADVLVIVSGPHAYVSPDWYESPAVPTWNYQSVHLYGKPHVTHDGDEIRSILADLVSRHHRRVSAEGIGQELSLGPETMDALVRNVVGFRVVVDRIEAVSKLSQNRSDRDYSNVICMLEKSEDPGALAVSVAMRQLRRS